jgi:hypothetical protein
MFCPLCRTEYREGFCTCADCSFPLVEELASIEEPCDQTSLPEDVIENFDTTRHFQGDLISIFETLSQSDILIVKSVLDEEKIPYHFSGDFFHMSGFLISPARLFVPSDLRDRVLEILKDLQMLA